MSSATKCVVVGFSSPWNIQPAVEERRGLSDAWDRHCSPTEGTDSCPVIPLPCLLLGLTVGILWDIVEMAMHVGAKAPEFSWADQCGASRPRVLCPSTLVTRGHTPSPPFLDCLG